MCKENKDQGIEGIAKRRKREEIEREKWKRCEKVL